MTRPARFVPLLIGTALALAAGPAQAGTVAAAGSDVTFTAAAGEASQVRAQAWEPGTIATFWLGMLTDDGVPPTPGANCVQSDTNESACQLAGPAGFRIDVGDGNDSVAVYGNPASTGTTSVVGGPGDDQLSVQEQRAALDGGPGNDTLLPDKVASATNVAAPTPAGVIAGGDGTDTVDYLSTVARGGLSVSLDGEANDGTNGENDNAMADIENVVGSAFNDNVLIGSAKANRLEGGGGNNRLVGGGGKDVLIGGGSDGADEAAVDGDDIVASGCEKQIWAPAVASSKLRRRGKRIRVTLTCPRASARSCRGKLRLTTRAGHAAPASGSSAMRSGSGLGATSRT